jgi:hypothetical protein
MLLVVGKGLTKFNGFALRDTGGSDLGAVTLVSKSTTMLMLRLPAATTQGEYDLTLHYGRTGETVVRVSVAAGYVPPESLTLGAFSPAVRADIEDAATLGGQSPASFALSSQVVSSSGGSMTGALSVATSGNSVSATTSASSGQAISGRATSATGPAVGVYGQSDSTGGQGVYGYAASPSGAAYGVRGESNSTSGIGAFGFATATSGSVSGVQGQCRSTSGVGVSGISLAATGTTYGAQGSVASSAGTGVAGFATSTTGNTFGVRGVASSVSGIGVAGFATDAAGVTIGVYGESPSYLGRGVFGYVSSATAGQGVRGESAGTSGMGVYGKATATSGLATGVWGETASSSGNGVNGTATSQSGLATGVNGMSDSTSGFGVSGLANATTGTTVGTFGYSASSSGIGVYGLTDAATGSTIGVAAISASSGGTGLYAVSSGSSSAALIANNNGSSGDIAVFWSGGVSKARIDKSGKGYFNGGTATSGADFAESVATREPVTELEPGDVIAIDPNGVRRFTLCRDADSSLVAGIYSTRPGVLARPGDVAGLDDPTKDEIPLAVTGIVPCKVCDEGGPIRAGDLLVSASRPGYAKRAPANPGPGTILAKSLGALEGGIGRVEVLITMR